MCVSFYPKTNVNNSSDVGREAAAAAAEDEQWQLAHASSRTTVSYFRACCSLFLPPLSLSSGAESRRSSARTHTHTGNAWESGRAGEAIAHREIHKFTPQTTSTQLICLPGCPPAQRRRRRCLSAPAQLLTMQRCRRPLRPLIDLIICACKRERECEPVCACVVTVNDDVRSCLLRAVGRGGRCQVTSWAAAAALLAASFITVV